MCWPIAMLGNSCSSSHPAGIANPAPRWPGAMTGCTTISVSEQAVVVAVHELARMVMDTVPVLLTKGVGLVVSVTV